MAHAAPSEPSWTKLKQETVQCPDILNQDTWPAKRNRCNKKRSSESYHSMSFKNISPPCFCRPCDDTRLPPFSPNDPLGSSAPRPLLIPLCHFVCNFLAISVHKTRLNKLSSCREQVVVCRKASQQNTSQSMHSMCVSWAAVAYLRNALLPVHFCTSLLLNVSRPLSVYLENICGIHHCFGQAEPDTLEPCSLHVTVRH